MSLFDSTGREERLRKWMNPKLGSFYPNDDALKIGLSRSELRSGYVYQIAATLRFYYL